MRHSSKELKCEHIEAREYLREKEKKLKICRNALFYSTILNGKSISQIVR